MSVAIETHQAEHPIAVDEYGAPVTFGPARWLVCFVPGLRSNA